MIDYFAWECNGSENHQYFDALVKACPIDEDYQRKLMYESSNLELKWWLFYYHKNDFGDIKLLLDLADYKGTRAISEHISTLVGSDTEPQSMKRLFKTKGLNITESPKAIEKILPNLSCPEFTEELRKIVTSVKTLPSDLRRQALKQLPEADEIYQMRFCPYCGSTDIEISSRNLGLEMDMFFYGNRCNSCGHIEKAPRGTNIVTRFDVSIEELL